MNLASKFFLLILGFLFLAPIANSAPPPKVGGKGSTPTVQYLKGNVPAKYPFSEAVQVDHMLYLSGQIGVDSSFTLVPGGMETEARQVMENIRKVLAHHGCTFDNVVKCTVMLSDMKEWPAFNAIYKEYFKADRLPARSALGCNGLALGARVEVECWAVK